MKKGKTLCVCMLALCLVAGGCKSWTNTGKGAAIGGGSGAALGAGVGALIGGGKGAGIGAAIGAAVGAGAGALIGKKMDQQQKELEQQLAKEAQIEKVEDANGLQAIKVTFSNGILFPTNGTALSSNAKTELSKFAQSLKQYPETNVQIFGYTDNTGTYAVNERVATGRADAVYTYLVQQGVNFDRLKAMGIPMADYIASNDTESGRAQNRRVEIYITASPEMVQQAENGTLQ